MDVEAYSFHKYTKWFLDDSICVSNGASRYLYNFSYVKFLAGCISFYFKYSREYKEVSQSRRRTRTVN